MESKTWCLKDFESIVAIARWYASGDNCQPFRFEFCPEGIEIFYRPELAKHHLNPGDIASSISAGFLLESLKAAALEVGWRVRGDLDLDQLSLGGSVGVLEVTSCRAVPGAALPVVLRRTSRRKYLRQKAVKSPELVARVNRTKSGKYRAMLTTNSSEPLMRMIAECDKYLANPNVVRELVRHTHLNQRKRTGFLPENLSLNWFDRFVFWLAQSIGPKWNHLLFAGPGRQVFATKALANLETSPNLLLISGPRPKSLSDWSDVGRCAQLAWGALGVEGYCAQPLSSASLILRTFESVGQADSLPKKDSLTLHRASGALKDCFSLLNGEHPIWLFRVGMVGVNQDSERLRLDVTEIGNPASTSSLGTRLESDPEVRASKGSNQRDLDQRFARKLFKLLPARARHILYRLMAKVPVESFSDRFTVEVASSKSDLARAYALLHDSYVGAGLMEVHPSGLRVDRFSVSPHTTPIVVKDNGKIIGSVSLIRDSDLGLPSDTEFKVQNDKLRKNGRSLVEISALAVDKGYRRPAHFVSLLLMKYLFNFCKNQFRSDYIVCATHPRAEDFYLGLFGFKRMGQVKSYGSAQGALAIHLSMPLSDRHAKKISNSYFSKSEVKNLPRFVMQNDLRFRYPDRNEQRRIFPVLNESEAEELRNKVGLVTPILSENQTHREFRVPTRIKAILQVGSSVQPCQIWDISSGGCYIKIKEKHLIGEEIIKIQFKLGGRSFRIKVKPIWKNKEQVLRLPDGVGLQFVNPSAELEDSILQLLEWNPAQNETKKLSMG